MRIRKPLWILLCKEMHRYEKLFHFSPLLPLLRHTQSKAVPSSRCTATSNCCTPRIQQFDFFQLLESGARERKLI